MALRFKIFVTYIVLLALTGDWILHRKQKHLQAINAF